MTQTIFARGIYFPKGGTGLPLLVMMDGWSGGIFYISNLARIAELYNVFAVGITMRGRDGIGGTKDGSGVEIHDIYDCVNAIRADHADILSPDKNAIVGWSGGGGNALAAACKFPDFWTTVVSISGMSDYGRDATYGWWQQNAPYRPSIETYIGGTPAALPNRYYARDATAAIANYTGGKIHLVHDEEDIIVMVSQSQRIATALDNAGLTNYEAHYSNAEDAVRYIHGEGQTGVLAPILEALYINDVLSRSAWTIPASGTVTVIGYLVTKRFSIWLNANGTATLGIDAAATVVYDTVTDTYTVTPLTGAIDVTITQGAKTGSATNISTETEIVVT